MDKVSDPPDFKPTLEQCAEIWRLARTAWVKVGAITVLLALLSCSREPQIAVPKVVGLSPEVAVRILESAGFSARIKGRDCIPAIYAGDDSPKFVDDQRPRRPDGKLTRAPRGSTVEVHVAVTGGFPGIASYSCDPLPDDAESPGFTLAAVAVILIHWFLAWGVILQDMERRGRNGFLYGLLTMLSLFVGLVVWLIARRRYPIVRGPFPPLGQGPEPHRD